MYWRGFTVIEQLYDCQGDSQMVLIKLRADSYYMPYCSLTLLGAYGLALMLKSSHIFMTEIHMHAIVLWSDSSEISYVRKHVSTVI